VAEAVLAIRIEQILKKDQILEMYLNQVYWGHNNYGIQTAARTTLAKSARNLNLAESAMMAGLIQAPQDYSPFVNMKLAKQRQEIVLNRMQELGWITPEEKAAASEEKLKFGRVKSFQGSATPHVTNAASQELIRRFGRDAVLKGGMRVQTSVDANMQQMAEETVSRWHRRLRGQGLYADQMALVAVDPRTHLLKR
jgi:penicillin-binding protein 1A